MGVENFSGGSDGGVGHAPAASASAAEIEPALPLVDRFGKPVRLRRRGRGRPEHEVNEASRDKVVIWLAQGYSDEEIAAALSISTRTLKKHYFHELGYRRTARMHLDAENTRLILDAASAGKVSAMSLAERKFQQMGQIATAKRHQTQEPKAAVPPRQGLKAQRKAAAEAVTGRYAPPPPPPRLIN